MKFFKKAVGIVMAVSMAAVLFAGCGGKKTEEESETTPVEETETETEELTFDPDETAVTLGDDTAPASELLFYYAITKTQWENNYGINDWDVELTSKGITYGEYLKEQVQSTVLQDIYLNRIADERDIKITDEEIVAIQEKAQAYLDSIDPEYVKRFGLNLDNVTEVLIRVTRAQAAYDDLIAEKRATLTEEDLESCKYRHVQHILISTDREYETDENGDIVVPTDEETAEFKAQKRAQAQDILDRARNGEDFEELAKEYTADSGVDYYINKEGTGPDGMRYYDAFAEAANALDEGGISDIVEVTYGYHIIKCVSLVDEDTFESAKTDLAATKVDTEYYDWMETAECTFFSKWADLKVE
ncbi:MAG: peptidylprolyl isomerase [Lachnospiraceae bacterium]|nr:peptidylprolyl isomerase [Lachnospiraceae bacterium]